MVTEPAKGQLTFEEFRHFLAQQLQIDESKVVPEASFVTDLMVDSISLVELMLSMEEKGINIPMEAAWDVQTVGDAYRIYRDNATTSGLQEATSNSS